MAFSTSQSDDIISEINITPLVDVMLVLLVTFIVTAPLLTNSIALSLPETASTGEAAQQNSISISVDAKGEIFLDKDRVSLESLPAALKLLHQQQPDIAVTLRADRGAEYGNVAKVLADVRNSGIVQLSVITETP